MNVIYKNYRIECEGKSFTLFSTEKEKEILIGYFTTFKSVMNRMYSLSKGTKKVKKVPDKELAMYIQEYNRITKKLTYLCKLVYAPIYKLDSIVNGSRKI